MIFKFCPYHFIFLFNFFFLKCLISFVNISMLKVTVSLIDFPLTCRCLQAGWDYCPAIIRNMVIHKNEKSFLKSHRDNGVRSGIISICTWFQLSLVSIYIHFYWINIEINFSILAFDVLINGWKSFKSQDKLMFM